MRKNIILVVCLMLFLSGCAVENKKIEQKSLQSDELLKKQQQDITNKNREYIFDKNQECLKYKVVLEKKMETEDNPFGKASLEQLFYSPKQNACLYVEYTDSPYSKADCYNRRLFDVLNDGPSSKPLENCLSVCPNLKLDDTTGGIQNDCVDFDKVLEEYKK